MKRYLFRLGRSCVLCEGPILARSERGARAWIRRFYGLRRLPPGTEVWRASPHGTRRRLT